MKSLISRTLAVAVGALLLSCGSSSTTVDLPFDDNKAVKDLSEGDLRELCKAGLEGLREGYGSTLCSLMGLIQDLSGQGSCEDARKACLNETFDTSSCDEGETNTLDCDITVGEIEACMNDVLQLAQDLLPDITCSTDLQDLQDINVDDLEDLDTPASCKKIEDNCEELDLGFDGLSLDDGGFS